MAFSASGTDYRGNQYSRDKADEGLTRALDAKGRAEKQARIKKSGERSGMQKLASTVARGAAAYYTGGLSETMGGGDMIDSAMLGTDSEGNAVKNEYGGLIKAGSGVYQGMKANKASDVAKKRASNKSDYNEQVAMAEKVGKYDPAEGLNMLTQAQDLRTLQQGQTQKGEDASLWGWDNKFDDLGMTPSQIKGQEVAQERQATTLASEGRRQGGQLDGRKAAEDQLRSRIRGASTMEQGPSREDLDKGGREERDNALLRSRIRDTQTADRGPSGEQLDKGGREVRESDRLRSRISNIQTADRGPTAEDLDRGEGEKRRLMTSLSDQGPSSFNTTQSESKMAQIKMDDMMDKEYDKKLGLTFQKNNDPSLLPYAEYEADHEGRAANMLGGKGYGYKPSIGKTYSEKEAEELSRRDTEGDSGLEKAGRRANMSNNVKRIEEKPWYKMNSGKDNQYLLEDRLLKEQEETEQQERIGAPPGRFTDLQPSVKSLLRKRIAARKQKANEVAIKKGGILSGSTVQ